MVFEERASLPFKAAVPPSPFVSSSSIQLWISSQFPLVHFHVFSLTIGWLPLLSEDCRQASPVLSPSSLILLSPYLICVSPPLSLGPKARLQPRKKGYIGVFPVLVWGDWTLGLPFLARSLVFMAFSLWTLVGALGLVECISYMLWFQGFITNEIYFRLLKIMCVMCVYTWLHLPVEAKRGCWTCWSCLGVDMSRLIWVLGTELGPSARSLSSHKDWAISPAPKIVCVLIFNIFCAPGFFCLMYASSVSPTVAVSQGCCFFKLREMAD